MFLENIVDNTIPTISPEISIIALKELFTQSGFLQLPVVTANQYLGMLDAKNLHFIEHEAESVIAATWYERSKPFIYAHAHPYDAQKILDLYQYDILPVLNTDDEYRGCIVSKKLQQFFAQLLNTDSEGSIIVLALALRDYSLSEIARICENEQVQLLSVGTRFNTQLQKLEICLKTNTQELSALLQAFERYDYEVLEYYGNSKNEEEIQRRYQLLMNYINM